MSKSDAEWYFWQSHESKIYYYMFFTLLKHYKIPLWSKATPEQREIVSNALEKALGYLKQQNIDWHALSGKEREEWAQKAIKGL